MKKLHLIAMATLAVVCVSGAQAQSRQPSDNGYYGEIGYSPMEVSDSRGNAKPSAIRLLIGNEMNKNLGIEAMLISTVSKDSHVGYDGSISSVGLLLKPKIALTDNTELFARVGVMRAEITASKMGSQIGTDLAYGVGIQTSVTKSVYVQLDYMNAYEHDGVAAKGYTLSLGTRF